MRIVVTGGAGFIGSYLCRFLLEKGNEVICVDNLYTGRKENIKELMNDNKFTFVEHDIVDPLFFGESINQIYNLACPASPVSYQSNSIRTVKINTLGIINMLGMARKHKARILQASTSEVYGDPKEHPQKESYFGNVNCIGVRACYDEGKRIAEALFSDYKREVKIDIRIVRIFNTYGPRMAVDDGRVVSNFIVQCLRDEDITIYGDGAQTRSFCYVADLVEGMHRAMNHKDYSLPINLGNPHEFTILELANHIKEITGIKSELVYKELPEDDPVKRKPDIALAKKLLGWEPKIPLKEGLKKTIEYFKEELKK